MREIENLEKQLEHLISAKDMCSFKKEWGESAKTWEKQVINLSLICLSTKWRYFTDKKYLQLFACKYIFKKIFHQDTQEEQLSTPKEKEAIQALQDLWRKQESPQKGKFPTAILPSSNKFPPIAAYYNINLFVGLAMTEFQNIPSHIFWDNCKGE